HHAFVGLEPGAAAEHRLEPGAFGDLDRAAGPEELRLLGRFSPQELEEIGGIIRSLLGHGLSLVGWVEPRLRRNPSMGFAALNPSYDLRGITNASSATAPCPLARTRNGLTSMLSIASACVAATADRRASAAASASISAAGRPRTP